MIPRTKCVAAALVIVATAACAVAPTRLFGQAVPGSTRFTVRIENVSNTTTLKLSTGGAAAAPTSPGVWAVYAGKISPLFVPGQRANPNGLERQAEVGSASSLFATIEKMAGIASSGVFSIPVGAKERSGIGPGKAYEFTVTANPGNSLSFTMMFAESNDIFLGPADGGIALFDATDHPVAGDVSNKVAFWDAGTEKNEEPGVGPNQAHRQKTPDAGMAENGVVHRLKDGFTYPRIEDVIRVTITPHAAH